jgi:hypothetical protein
MSYIDKNLISGEAVCYRTHVHWVVLVAPMILGGLLAAAALNSGRGGLLLIGAVIVGFAWLSRAAAEFDVTNKRVVMKVGIFHQRSLEILLQKVESIAVDQSLTGRTLDYGTIVVVGTGGTAESFRTVERPAEFRRQVQEQIENRLQGNLTPVPAPAIARVQTIEPAQAESEVESEPTSGGGMATALGLVVIIGIVLVVLLTYNFNNEAPNRAPIINAYEQHPTGKPPKSARIAKAEPELGTDGFVQSSLNPGFRTYLNGRFGFRIDYPQSFAAEEPPVNGDGITLISPDGNAKLVVVGGNNPGFTLKEYYDRAIEDVRGKLGYRIHGGSWFVVTWEDKDILGYRKMFVGNGSQNSFTFTFPSDQRSQYESIVTTMEKSFHSGDLEHAQ